MKIITLFLLVLFSFKSYASDSTILKVHFLFGSKPKKKYRKTEGKWFGGLLGGHVGIEGSNGKILNFVPSGKFHIIQKKERHSIFTEHSFNSFYSLFGSEVSKVKKGIIIIPISAQQKKKFDSITNAYKLKTPYDYAFIGKRCGSAAYDILSQLAILPRLSHTKTVLKIFYPRKLRKQLLKRSKQYNWTVTSKKGTRKRKWERD